MIGSSAPSIATPRRSRREVLTAAGAELLPSLLAAAIAGFLVAGVGGRLAMLLLRVTSGSDVVGLESDDGFVIGRVTTDTIGLVALVAVAATLSVGPIYTVARLWFPQRWRSVAFAAFFGILGGGLLVHEDGIDFRVLTPQALAVALFVAIPLVFGVVLESLRGFVESRLPQLPEWALLVLPVAVLATFVLIAPPVGIALSVGALGAVLLGQGDRLGTALRSDPVAWLGRLGMVAIAGLAGADLTRDLNALF